MTELCPICFVPIGTCFPPRQGEEQHCDSVADGVVSEVASKTARTVLVTPFGPGLTTTGTLGGLVAAHQPTHLSPAEPNLDARRTGPTSVADILRDAATKPGPLGDIARRAGLQPPLEIPANLRPRDYYNLTTPLGHCVYIFRAEDGHAVYIGQSRRVGNRIDKHRSKPWWPEVKTILCIPVPGATREDCRLNALDEEWRLIGELRPTYNVAGAVR